jgi:hypothetical protein
LVFLARNKDMSHQNTLRNGCGYFRDLEVEDKIKKNLKNLKKTLRIRFFDLSIYLSREYFIEETVFVTFKMASNVQDGGGNSK